MELDLIFKVFAIGIIVAILSRLLKYSERPEQEFMLTIAGLVVVLLMIIPEILLVFDTIKSSFGF